MKRKNLTIEQIKAKDEFIKKLKSNGWFSQAENKSFDEGDDFRSAAYMEYSGEEVSLIAEYNPLKELIHLSFIESDIDGDALGFSIEIEGQLDRFITSLVDIQKRLSVKNYKQRIEKMIKLFPKTKKEKVEVG